MFNSNKSKIDKKEDIVMDNKDSILKEEVINRRPLNSEPRVKSDSRTQNKTIISKDCLIKGEIKGTDDISIFGKVEGSISLKEAVVTIESGANVKASIFAKNVNINGNISGNIEASEKIIITDSGNVTGDMIAPKIVLKDGSYFKGNISMIDTKINTAPKINNNSTPNKPITTKV